MIVIKDIVEIIVIIVLILVLHILIAKKVHLVQEYMIMLIHMLSLPEDNMTKMDFQKVLKDIFQRIVLNLAILMKSVDG